jgi:hypothetical protein
VSIASQLSDWGEQTGDDAISDISDKVGVLLSEIGEQEDLYAHNLDDSRGILKIIRNTEKSVQPSRDSKTKIQDEIAKLKAKEPESAKLVILEQELVRAEAENLVAEAQLTNIVSALVGDEGFLLISCKTRQKLKEAYATEFAATIERAEKQIVLARHGRRLLNLLDDTPVVPGDTRPVYEHGNAARQILNDAEDDLREWQPELEDVGSSAHMIDNNLMPSSTRGDAIEGEHENGRVTTGPGASQGTHLSEHNDTASRVTSGTSINTGPAYSQSESEAGVVTH